MPSNKGDRPMNRDDRTLPDQPNAIVGAETETLGTLAAVAGAPTETKHNTAPGFDPWRFGTHDVSAELRQEILEKGFPDTPDDKLFTKRHKSDPAESGDKSAKPGDVESDIDGDASRWDADPARRADTLRLARKPQSHSPWRATFPWLLISAVGAFVLLWLLLGRDDPKPPTHEPEQGHSVPSAPPLAAPSSPREVAPAPAAPEPSAQLSLPEPKPTKLAVPAEGHSIGSPHAAQPATGKTPIPPVPATKPSSSRIVPADD